MREITEIIVHCSDTYPDMNIGANEIRQWHVQERGWDDIGYHYVIRRNGEVEKGREDDVRGAHAAGHNENSIGVCLVGGMARSSAQPVNFTRQQWTSLEDLIQLLSSEFPSAEVIGHNDISPKPCPMFDVEEWWNA